MGVRGQRLIQDKYSLGRVAEQMFFSLSVALGRGIKAGLYHLEKLF